MTRKHVLPLLLVIATSVPAFGILGLGDIVFDPANYEEAIRQLIQMEQQYEQLVKTYTTVRSQYEQMLYMAKRVPVNMSSRYRPATTLWKYPAATNTYGTTAPWISAINSGLSVANSYAQTTEALATYGAALANIPSEQADRLKKHYGTLELADGANIQTIETIGSIRRNAQVNEVAIQGLEDDSLSADPDMNTEIAVLNKINAANVLGLRTSQDTNKVLVSLAEQQVIEAKRRRDAEARAINQHIRFTAEEKSLLKTDGITEAIVAWRLP